MTSTFVAWISVGTRLAATVAANPGIGPAWLIPGVRPPKKEDNTASDESSLARGEIAIDVVCIGLSRRLALTLLLPAADFEFDVDVVATLRWEMALDLSCAGVVVAWIAEGRYCADEDDVADILLGVIAATDLRSAILFVGATPHLPRTQPPTDPIRPFDCVAVFVLSALRMPERATMLALGVLSTPGLEMAVYSVTEASGCVAETFRVVDGEGAK